ncbi:MAG: winged helix-turn-helix domain-containing protein, partial [Alphaproteobacteria bacterium]|nr:winged helix-turn-helix domain-containing protein [Alphaproteobacteria bacterium]
MIYRFSDYSLDTDSFDLAHGTQAVAVEPQVFSLLQYLVENRDRVVSKDEIMAAVWDGRIVSDAALNSRISAARQAVGDDGKAQAVIKTFPRRGFRFVAALNEDDDTAPTPEPTTVSDRPSIAVLPFHNLSDDPEQEYFSDGITEDIITALSRVRQFHVVARNTTFAYKGRAIGDTAVAGELGVRYVLEGSVRRAGDRLRISAQLIDGTTGNHLWAERYDRDQQDIFEVQDDITKRVVGAIAPELARAERDRAILKRPEDLGAWDLYQRGMSHLWDRGEFGQPPEIEIALDYFNKSIGLDPRFPSAHAAIAQCSFFKVFFGSSEQRSRAFDEGVAAARKGIELDPKDTDAYTQLALLHTAYRQPEEAMRICNAAIAIDPHSAHAIQVLGMAEVCIGDAEEGLRHCETAVQLMGSAPIAGPNMVWIAMANIFLSNYEKAVDWAKKALDVPSTQIWGNAALTSA